MIADLDIDTSKNHYRNTMHGRVRLAPVELQNRYLRTIPNGAGDSLDMYQCGTEPDGSCFFHTVCAAMNIEQWHNRTSDERIEIGLRFRNRIKTILTSNKWKSFWEEKLAQEDLLHMMDRVPDCHEIARRLANPRDWADVWLISWTMRQLNISCIFFDQKNGSRMYCGVRGEPNATTHILCLWCNHVHFEPLLLHDRSTGTLHTTFASDDPILQHILSIYNDDQCMGAKIAI